MNNEKITICGVDVAECEFFDGSYLCKCDKILIDEHKKLKNIPSVKYVNCRDNYNCYYKQLKRKEQECEKLKAQIETYSKMLETPEFKVALTDVRTGEREVWRKLGNKAKRYTQALDEISSIATNSDMLPCADPDADCTKCKDKITEKGKRCMRYGLDKIKNVVAEAKDTTNET